MCWSTPVVLRSGERDELVYNGSHHVVGYDPETGEELWRCAGSSREAIPMIVVGGGLLFSTSGRNGPTLAIRPGGDGDVTETHVQWKSLRGGPHVPSPVYYEGNLFIVNDTGIVTCLNASDGTLKWQDRLKGRFSMSPVEAGGLLIMTNEDGLTYVLRAADHFEILGENDLGEPNLATPAVLGGRIYFRTASNLICVAETR
jgi:outer membrane protein assembly factor BamB